jgi:hypothetical protein
LNKEEGYKRGSFPPLIRKEEEVGNPINEKWVDSPTLDPNQTETVLKYKQNVRNETNKWPGPFKGLHKAVSKVKGKQIRTSPTVSPLETCNSHQKMAATVRTLLKSEKMTADKRKPNIIPIQKFSIKENNIPSNIKTQ